MVLSLRFTVRIKEDSAYKTMVNSEGSLLDFPCLNFYLLDRNRSLNKQKSLIAKVKRFPGTSSGDDVTSVSLAQVPCPSQGQ